MIRVQSLSKYYGTHLAVDDISFFISSGEIVGFLGPNGAGKSTTMRILTGFISASQGSAFIANCEVHQDPIGARRKIGYMPERVPLYDEMSVSGYLRYVAEIKGVPRSGRRAEVSRVIERCGLEGYERRAAGHLSKGYRQRVGLAQALIGSPPVIILDEPTAGLDPKQIVDIRETIRALAPEHTVLLSTHILPEVAMICDRAIIVNRGKVVAEENVRDLGGRGLEERFLSAVAGEAPAA